MIRTKDTQRIVLGFYLKGSFQIRRVSDLSVISNLEIHSDEALAVCELEDGTFVSTSDPGVDDDAVGAKRWNDRGEVLQTFGNTDNSKALSFHLVWELKSNLLALDTDFELVTWKLDAKDERNNSDSWSPRHSSWVMGLVRLIDNDGSNVTTTFASGSMDKTIRVWDIERGRCIQTIETSYKIHGILRLGGVRDRWVVTTGSRIEVRRM